jgi:hypothetical protein
MRRYAPVIFALLSALFLLERAVSGGAFAGQQPTVIGLAPQASLGAGADCLAREDLLVTLVRAGARLEPEPVPFCTDRPELTDWIVAHEPAGPRHLAFDAQGCLADWHPAESCP